MGSRKGAGGKQNLGSLELNLPAVPPETPHNGRSMYFLLLQSPFHGSEAMRLPTFGGPGGLSKTILKQTKTHILQELPFQVSQERMGRRLNEQWERPEWGPCFRRGKGGVRVERGQREATSRKIEEVEGGSRGRAPGGEQGSVY